MIKSREYLDNAIKSLQIADHMTYVTYPLINEKKLLLKILDEINKCVVNCISFIVLREGGFSDGWNEVFERFLRGNDSRSFMNNEEIKKIREILDLTEKHKESAMEFVRRDKVVIMSDELNIQTIDIQKIKEYLEIAKKLIKPID